MLFGKRRKAGQLELVASTHEVGPVEADWVTLVPDGPVTSSSGDFVVDAESGRLIVEHFTTHGVDLVLDYEHQTLGGKYGRPDGRAPAAGWITAMRYRPGLGIQGLVRWTPDALEAIDNAAYRYLSPVVAVRKSDRKAVGLHSVGLTNVPAIQGMTALAASEDIRTYLQGMEAIVMAEKEGSGTTQDAPPSSDNDTASEAALVDSLKEALAMIRSALGLAEDATVEQLLEAISALKEPDTAGTEEEPVADKDTGKGLSEEKVLALVDKKMAKRDRWNEVERLIASEKMLERDRDHALSLNDDQFKHFVETLGDQARPPAGQTAGPGAGGGGANRQKVIVQACREYGADESLQKMTSREAYVALALRDNDKAPLTDEERTKHELVAA